MVIGKRHLKRFILGGWSEFQVENLNTGNSYNYRVQSSKDKPGMYFVRLIDGFGVSYAGLLIDDEGSYKFIKGAKGTKSVEDIEIKALLYVLENIDRLPSSVIVSGNGRCSTCGGYLDKVSLESMRQGKCEEHQELL